MEVKTKTVDLRVVEATPGHLLYRSGEPLETAYFAPRVYLGSGDSPDNYAEIPLEEAEKEMKRRERAAMEIPADDITPREEE